MILTANHITTPAWLPIASGTINAVQHRRAPRYDAQKIEDDPLDELLGAPDPLTPMVNLAKDWAEVGGAEDRAFCVKRPDQLGTTLQLLAALRLCATFKDFQTAYMRDANVSLRWWPLDSLRVQRKTGLRPMCRCCYSRYDCSGERPTKYAAGAVP